MRTTSWSWTAAASCATVWPADPEAYEQVAFTTSATALFVDSVNWG